MKYKAKHSCEMIQELRGKPACVLTDTGNASGLSSRLTVPPNKTSLCRWTTVRQHTLKNV